jgi:peptidoglycan/xylan/chitin deacetylase (PgdA/CDA1 family)
MGWMKNHRSAITATIMGFLLSGSAFCQQPGAGFVWPEGKTAALSLSFDDGRDGQVLRGTPLLDKYGVKATFYVLPKFIEPQLELWKKAVAAGHEIGSHTTNHPCTGNFNWVREEGVEVENYTLKQMRLELEDTNSTLHKLLGVTPRVFAYPCGNTSVGRGAEVESYIPLVAKMFLSGRGWPGETSNNPAFVDLTQVMGQRMDDQTFEQILPILQTAQQEGRWVVLGGHEVGKPDIYTTDVVTLEKIIQYAQRPENKLWLAPVGTVARYIRDHR